MTLTAGNQRMDDDGDDDVETHDHLVDDEVVSPRVVERLREQATVIVSDILASAMEQIRLTSTDAEF